MKRTTRTTSRSTKAVKSKTRKVSTGLKPATISASRKVTKHKRSSKVSEVTKKRGRKTNSTGPRKM